MLRTLFAISCLLVSFGCATTSAQFKPIGNCVTSISTVGNFGCVDATGTASTLPWEKAEDLICFHYADFKSHEETCHTP